MGRKSVRSKLAQGLKVEGQKARARPVKPGVASQLAAAMEKEGISKTRLAELLKTSRSQVDRLLDPKRDITLGSLQKAAGLVGKRLVVELV
jgi:predicted transcriptional regulator